MKKIVSLLLALALLLPAMASAEIDLSTFSFKQLVMLQEKISKELITRPEWKEVTVPQGLWQVGVDIPAGHWTISAYPGVEAYVVIGTVMTNTMKEIDSYYSRSDGYYFSQIVKSSSVPSYNPATSVESFDIELKKGVFVQVDWASVIFTPYAGKPLLGF